jgi:hypothetical protein
MKRTLRAVPTPLPATAIAPLEDIDPSLDDNGPPRPGAADLLLRLRLDAEDLERLD